MAPRTRGTKTPAQAISKDFTPVRSRSDFRHLCEKVRLLNESQHTGSKDNTCNQLAHNLRSLAFSGKNTKQFCEYDNDCQVF